MLISHNIPPFKCPKDMWPHLQPILNGIEYDVPIYNADVPFRILDLGANIGAFSVWASYRWPGCQIHAYEPHPETFKTLTTNMSHYPNVSCHEWGVGTTTPSGMRALLEGENNIGEASFYVTGVTKGTGIHVEVKDPLTLPEADILKMDIEGCEVEVLEPLIHSGRKFLAVMFEYHRINDRRILDVLLNDYVLTGAKVIDVKGRGVCRYIHKDVLK